MHSADDPAQLFILSGTAQSVTQQGGDHPIPLKEIHLIPGGGEQKAVLPHPRGSVNGDGMFGFRLGELDEHFMVQPSLDHTAEHSGKVPLIAHTAADQRQPRTVDDEGKLIPHAVGDRDPDMPRQRQGGITVAAVIYIYRYVIHIIHLVGSRFS